MNPNILEWRALCWGSFFTPNLPGCLRQSAYIEGYAAEFPLSRIHISCTP